MTWGKCLIISLGWMLITQVAHARAIDSFTDDRGTIHITNLEPKKPVSPVKPPSPAASLEPASVTGKAPVTAPAKKLVPEAQSTVPKLEVVPAKPVPVAPRPGSGITHTEDLGKAKGGRTGNREAREAAAEAPSPRFTQVSWPPPQPARAAPNGKGVPDGTQLSSDETVRGSFISRMCRWRVRA